MAEDGSVIKRIQQRTSAKTKIKVRKKLERPFSQFGRVLPDELINWDKSDWAEGEYVQLAASEAWNLDEFSEEGYIAMKRMMADLINPNDERLNLDQFTNRLNTLYNLIKK